VERGAFCLDVGLDVAPGQVVALLGPNGAGKSTALGALAGLVPLTSGRIDLGGACLDDAGRTLVPVEARRVGMVFQDYLLFPHLSALDNVAFGLRCRGVGRRDAAARARGWLARVGLEDVARSRPRQLSGGQAQRVALARALVTDPGLLLLDEPLAALDASTRLSVRSDLRRHLGEYAGCTVLVTHDPLDAMVLADVLVVVEAGRVVQRGTPSEVARAPRSRYAAELVGLNLYTGASRGTRVDLLGGGALVCADEREGEVFCAVAPHAVALHRLRPETSARNVWQGRVAGMEQHASTVRVVVHGQPDVLADVTTAAVADLGLGPGSPVWVSVKAGEVHSYPA
jgi:molybdate transport system ATP-binding protein